MTCIEDQDSVLSTGDKHVVVLAPQVPIGNIAHPAGRAPTRPGR